jgi:hypothetical protein
MTHSKNSLGLSILENTQVRHRQALLAPARSKFLVAHPDSCLDGRNRARAIFLSDHEYSFACSSVQKMFTCEPSDTYPLSLSFARWLNNCGSASEAWSSKQSKLARLNSSIIIRFALCDFNRLYPEHRHGHNRKNSKPG